MPTILPAESLALAVKYGWVAQVAPEPADT